jgi:hypothetical protein
LPFQSQTKLSHFLNRRAKHRGWKKLEETIQTKIGDIQVLFPDSDDESDESASSSPEIPASEVEPIEPITIFNNFGHLLQYEELRSGLVSDYFVDDWAQYSLNQIFGNVC